MKPRAHSTLSLQALAGHAIQGTLVELMLRCGTPSCGCHQDPARRHGPHLYLKFRDEKGRSTSLYIPRESEREIRAAVLAWSRLWQTIVRLSHRNRRALKQRLRRRWRG
jgi:hypothetical protein